MRRVSLLFYREYRFCRCFLLFCHSEAKPKNPPRVEGYTKFLPYRWGILHFVQDDKGGTEWWRGERIIIIVNEAKSNSGQEFAEWIVFVVVPFPFVQILGISFYVHRCKNLLVFRRRIAQKR